MWLFRVHKRRLGLPVHLQSLLFSLFAASLDATVSSAKRDGSYDEGVSDLKGFSVRRRQKLEKELLENPGKVDDGEILYQDHGTGGITRLHRLEVDRGMPFEVAVSRLFDAVNSEKETTSAMDNREPSAIIDDYCSEDEDGNLRGFIVSDDLKEGEFSDDGDVSFLNDNAKEPQQVSCETNTDPVDAPLVRLGKEAKRLNVGGFYVSRSKQFGELRYVLALRKMDTAFTLSSANSGRGDILSKELTLFFIARPNTGKSPVEKEKWELDRAYERVCPSKARQPWCEAFIAAARTCSHGSTCKQTINRVNHKRRYEHMKESAPPPPPRCMVGRRVQPVAVIVGCVVPLWTRLAKVLNEGGRQAYTEGKLANPLPKSERILRIVRATLDDTEVKDAGGLVEHRIVSSSTFDNSAQSSIISLQTLTSAKKSARRSGKRLVGLRWPGSDAMIQILRNSLKQLQKEEEITKKRQFGKLLHRVIVNTGAKLGLSITTGGAVHSVMDKSPCSIADIRPNDVIMAVGNNRCEALPPSQIVNLIRGELLKPNTQSTVKLCLLRPRSITNTHASSVITPATGEQDNPVRLQAEAPKEVNEKALRAASRPEQTILHFFANPTDSKKVAWGNREREMQSPVTHVSSSSAPASGCNDDPILLIDSDDDVENSVASSAHQSLIAPKPLASHSSKLMRRVPVPSSKKKRGMLSSGPLKKRKKTAGGLLKGQQTLGFARKKQ